MAAPVFPHASVSEILLCSIKDEYYIHALEESVYAIIEAVKGPHVLAQFKPEAKAMASFAYYSVTSGTGRDQGGCINNLSSNPFRFTDIR